MLNPKLLLFGRLQLQAAISQREIAGSEASENFAWVGLSLGKTRRFSSDYYCV